MDARSTRGRRVSSPRLGFHRDKFATIHSQRARSSSSGGLFPLFRAPLRLSSPSFSPRLYRTASDCKLANAATWLSTNLLASGVISSRNLRSIAFPRRPRTAPEDVAGLTEICREAEKRGTLGLSVLAKRDKSVFVSRVRNSLVKFLNKPIDECFVEKAGDIFEIGREQLALGNSKINTTYLLPDSHDDYFADDAIRRDGARSTRKR